MVTAVEKKHPLLFNKRGDHSPRRPQNGLAVDFIAGTGVWSYPSAALPLFENRYLPVFSCASYIISDLNDLVQHIAGSGLNGEILVIIGVGYQNHYHVGVSGGGDFLPVFRRDV